MLRISSLFCRSYQ